LIVLIVHAHLAANAKRSSAHEQPVGVRQ